MCQDRRSRTITCKSLQSSAILLLIPDVTFAFRASFILQMLGTYLHVSIMQLWVASQWCDFSPSQRCFIALISVDWRQENMRWYEIWDTMRYCAESSLEKMVHCYHKGVTFKTNWGAPPLSYGHNVWLQCKSPRMLITSCKELERHFHPTP